MQFLICVVLLIGHWIFTTKIQAVSAFLGALVAFLPNLVWAKIVFQFKGAKQARKIVQSFYIGEAIKLGLSAGLFSWVFLTYPVFPGVFFISYITVISTYWLAPFLIETKQNRFIK